jgi:hypothetical protein
LPEIFPPSAQHELAAGTPRSGHCESACDDTHINIVIEID